MSTVIRRSSVIGHDDRPWARVAHQCTDDPAKERIEVRFPGLGHALYVYCTHEEGAQLQESIEHIIRAAAWAILSNITAATRVQYLGEYE